MSRQENTSPNGSPDFGLPDGYFHRSALAIAKKIEWMEEHKDLPRLVALQTQKSFGVPADYFNVNSIKLELLDYPVLLSLSKTSAFKTPAGYFEEAEVKELAKIMGDEVPVVGSLFDKRNDQIFKLPVKQQPFKTSAGYFAENKKQIEATLLKNNKPAKVIRLFGARMWAAAAALCLIALGLWLYDYYAAPARANDCGTMACIDKADLLKTKNLENLETDELYELVNSKKLQQELEKDQVPEPKKDRIQFMKKKWTTSWMKFK